MWAVNDAIAAELMRPDPAPFTPPTWSGLWHLFAGDLRTYPRRVNDVAGRTRCGVRIILRSEVAEAAVAVAMPGVDACGRCRRSAAVAA